VVKINPQAKNYGVPLKINPQAKNYGVPLKIGPQAKNYGVPRGGETETIKAMLRGPTYSAAFHKSEP
jgi:hypothetical protein